MTIPNLSSSRTIIRLAPDRNGWQALGHAPAEPWIIRDDFGVPPHGRRPLVSFVHLTDLHVMDPQSPARLEYLDRHSDPDSPLRNRFPAVGTYRPQELLTTQVVAAMVHAVNEITASLPAPPSFAVATGDVIDNGQVNELANYLALLDGGRVRPNSGAPGSYEGVAGRADGDWDERYWHPDPPPGTGIDRPTRRHGFPRIPGLLDAACRSFSTGGLDLPWYTVHGNHDALLQGTVPADETLAALAVGDRRLRGLAPGTDIPGALSRLREIGPAFYPGPGGAPWTKVTPDPSRRLLARGEFVAAHLGVGRPAGHGFTAANRLAGTAYWKAELDQLTLIGLDTTNPHGGWQGSVDTVQLAWLEEQLRAGSSRFADRDGVTVRRQRADDRPIVVASHHTADTLTNSWAPDGSTRALGPAVLDMLLRFPNVVLWVNGHTHRHRITARPRPPTSPFAGGLWEVTTASHIDWPQQSRLIELLGTPGAPLSIRTTVIDHAGAVTNCREIDDADGLAGVSRALAANDWQRSRELGTAGGCPGPGDRNALLMVAAP